MQEDPFFGKRFSVFGDFITSTLRRLFFSVDMRCLIIVFYSKIGSESLGLIFNKTVLASRGFQSSARYSTPPRARPSRPTATALTGDDHMATTIIRPTRTNQLC
jgi:hypothetical protein